MLQSKIVSYTDRCM